MIKGGGVIVIKGGGTIILWWCGGVASLAGERARVTELISTKQSQACYTPRTSCMCWTHAFELSQALQAHTADTSAHK